MKQGEYKEINGHIVRKGAHPTFRNRDGYAKSCYYIFESMDAMKNWNYIGIAYTMPEVKMLTKDL